MGDVVDMPRSKIPTKDDFEFVRDMARFSEGLTDESAIRKKYRLADDAWTALGNDDDLVRAITDEKTRRVRDGSFKREKSQLLVTRAPDVLSNILLDENANARHRIDSCKALNDLASNGPGDTAPAADRFIINIVLNSDGAGGEPAALHFNKSIRPLAPGETDPDDISPNDTGMIAAIAAKKPTDGNGNGNAI